MANPRMAASAVGHGSAGFAGGAVGGLLLLQDGHVVEASPRVGEIFGYELAELRGLPILRLVAPESVELVRESLQRRLSGQEDVAQYPFRGIRKDGRILEIEVCGWRVDHGGKPAIRSVLLDVSERVCAARALKKSEELFRTLIENALDVTLVLDASGQIRYASPSIERVLGYGPSDREGRSGFELIHPQDREKVRQIFFRNTDIPGPIPDLVEFRVRHKNGSWRYFEALGNNQTQDPSIAGVIVNYRDITERKLAGETLRKLQRAVEYADNAIFMTDPQGTITFVNPAFQRVYGYPPEEAVGQTPRLLKSGRHSRAFYDLFWKKLLAGEPIRGEIVNKTRDGRMVTVEESVTRVLDGGGRCIGFIAVQNDVTGKRLLEEQFRQSQKMEAVGRLAGGVAHDFNNLLTAILGYSGLLLSQEGLPEPVTEAMTEIHKAGERASSLTRQLLAFSRKQVLLPEILDLNAIVRDLEKMLRRLIGENIALVTELDGRLGAVRADPGQIEQVLLNLIVNARDAMPDGGTVTVSTSDCPIDEAFVRTHPGIRAGRHSLISIRDTGQGMAPDVLSHLFEPFFTTKEKGKGTGLGLATVYGIVKQSGGYIGVESEPQRGTQFRVYLPVVEGTTAEAGAPRARSPERSGQETILLVEDDDLVRRLTKVVLTRGGYTVVEARDGQEGLDQARSFEGRIDLVLTDVIMPGMNGRELVRQLGAFGLLPRVLYMSGYTDEALRPEDSVEAREQLLQKPFLPDVLLRRIRETLDRPAEGR